MPGRLRVTAHKRTKEQKNCEAAPIVALGRFLPTKLTVSGVNRTYVKVQNAAKACTPTQEILKQPSRVFWLNSRTQVCNHLGNDITPIAHL